MPIIDFDDPYAQIIRPRSRRSSQNRPRRIDMPMPIPVVSAAQAKIGQQRKRNAKKIRDQHAPLDAGTRALLAVWDRRPDAVELATVALDNAKAAAFRNTATVSHVEAWQSVLSDLTAGV